MKPMDDARAGLLSQLIEQDQGFETLRAVERDAYEQGRAEGRREGLLEAAKVCGARSAEHRRGKGGDNINQALEAATCERLVRKLIEAGKGGGG